MTDYDITKESDSPPTDAGEQVRELLVWATDYDMDGKLQTSNVLRSDASAIERLTKEVALATTQTTGLCKSLGVEPLDTLNYQITQIDNAIVGLTADLAAAKAELDAAVKVIERLPKTADGVPIVPGVDHVWINPGDPGGFVHSEHYFDRDSQPVEVRIGAWHGDHFWFDNKTATFAEGDYWFGKCYSTREAAISRQEAKQ